MDPSDHAEWVNEVYGKTYPGLLAFLQRVAPDQAEDLLQHAYVRLLECSDFDRTCSGVDHWLLKVALNAFRTDQKRASRSIDLDAAGAEPAASDSPMRVLVARDLAEYVETTLAIGIIRKTQADVLRLRFFGGLSHQEINEALRIRSSRSELCEALNFLRRLFGAELVGGHDE